MDRHTEALNTHQRLLDENAELVASKTYLAAEAGGLSVALETVQGKLTKAEQELEAANARIRELTGGPEIEGSVAWWFHRCNRVTLAAQQMRTILGDQGYDQATLDEIDEKIGGKP